MHFSESYVGPLPAFLNIEHVSAGAWEFPVLLKYRLSEKAARPFINAGPAFDALTLKDSFAVAFSLPVSPASGTNSSSLALRNTFVAGFAAGVGLELPVDKFHISPEIRYTPWLSPHFAADGLLDGKQDQIEFLLGFSF